MDCVHRQTGAEAELDARQGVGGAAAHLLLLSAPRGLNEQSCFHKWEFHFTVSSLHQHFPKPNPSFFFVEGLPRSFM